jgi:hypothetical protein
MEQTLIAWLRILCCAASTICWWTKFVWSYTIGGSAAAAKVDPLAGGNGDSVAME